MLQTNSLVNEERNAFYSQYSLKELENQLLEEKSLQNRNVIRQVIRKKRKDNSEPNDQVGDYMDENSREIENLRQSLKTATDFFDQCKIRSTILHLQKNQKKIDFPQKVECNSVPNNNSKYSPAKSLTNKNTLSLTTKQLIHDEMSTTSIDSAILQINDSVKLEWIMPFKILSSIECSWKFKEQNINISHAGRIVSNFDGKQATLTISNLHINDTGIYQVTVHSQRLKKNVLKFNIIVNGTNNDKSVSSIVHEEPESKVEPKVEPRVEPNVETKVEPKTVIQTASPHSEIICKPVVGLHKNRFNRHKTMVGQDMLGAIKPTLNFKSIPTKEEIKSPNPPTANVVRRFNRSATSAKDIILTFCKLNTDEYDEYGVCVENLSTSWTDGLAFCALIHHFYPEAFDFSKLNKANRKSNFELAFSTAFKYAEIYPLLDVDDMLVMEKPDWKCVFTYVQCFYKTFRTHPKNKLKTIPI